MRIFSQVHVKFWTGDSLADASKDERLLALYILTGPHSNMLGAFRIPVGYLMTDHPYLAEAELYAALDGLQRREFLKWVQVKRDIDFCVLNYIKYNPVQNPKMGLGVRREFASLTDSFSFRRELACGLLTYGKYLDPDFIQNLTSLAQDGNFPALPLELGSVEKPAKTADSSKPLAKPQNSESEPLAKGINTPAAARKYPIDTSDTDEKYPIDRVSIPVPENGSQEREREVEGGSDVVTSLDAGKTQVVGLTTDSPATGDGLSLFETVKGGAGSETTLASYELPLKDGNHWRLSPELMTGFESLCPDIDLEAEMGKMRVWLLGNPDRRPVGGKGARQFVSNWLNRGLQSGEYAKRAARSSGNGPAMLEPESLGFATSL